jgi:hypothetical protein
LKIKAAVLHLIEAYQVTPFLGKRWQWEVAAMYQIHNPRTISKSRSTKKADSRRGSSAATGMNYTM